MTAAELQAHKDAWYAENAAFGKELGYPECCIKEFCDQPPELLHSLFYKVTSIDKMRYKAGCINGEFTGFVPCCMHAKQISMGLITLQSVIQNRNPSFTLFPNFK